MRYAVLLSQIFLFTVMSITTVEAEAMIVLNIENQGFDTNSAVGSFLSVTHKHTKDPLGVMSLPSKGSNIEQLLDPEAFRVMYGNPQNWHVSLKAIPPRKNLINHEEIFNCFVSKNSSASLQRIDIKIMNTSCRVELS